MRLVKLSHIGVDCGGIGGLVTGRDACAEVTQDLLECPEIARKADARVIAENRMSVVSAEFLSTDALTLP
jgi:hypothetical protein